MKGWTIDVCKKCGRIATWPFCQHRPKGYTIDRESWCVSISVRPTTVEGKELAKLNSERAKISFPAHVYHRIAEDVGQSLNIHLDAQEVEEILTAHTLGWPDGVVAAVQMEAKTYL
jgi:hypothetical protein